MNRLISFLLLTLIACHTEKTSDGPYFGNGFLNGWADQNSISIWTRLTENPEMNTKGQAFIPLKKKEVQTLAAIQDVDVQNKRQIPAGLSLKDMEGACMGADGEVQLNYYPQTDPSKKIQTVWTAVDASKNFTHQWKLNNLLPNTTYKVDIFARKETSHEHSDTISGSFITAPAATEKKAISFAMVSCHDYIRRDSNIGHKIYPSMTKDAIDFYVHTGDIEYYDKPNPWALTEAMMRFKWDRLLALPLQRDFYSQITTYFMRDDHDVLSDDAFPSKRFGEIDFKRGIEIFDIEQFPANEKTYKTIRWGKDLQIWLLDNRKFRSKNTDEDGPNKTILGTAQKQWLFSTITVSDATFKLIITPSPILGPDRQNKKDNHSNKAFQHEGDELRSFINQFDNVFICTGDRHWQYATHIEDSNLWEFGTGSGADIHAGGWNPDNVLPEHQFLRVKGGYLYGKVYQEQDTSHLKFEHRDVNGHIVFEKVFTAKNQ